MAADHDREENGDLEPISAIFQALGAASVCWSAPPQGVFDSTRATEIGDALVAELKPLRAWYIHLPWSMSNEDGEYCHIRGHIGTDEAVRATLATAAWEGWLDLLVDHHGSVAATEQHLKAGVELRWLRPNADDDEVMEKVAEGDAGAEAWTQVQL